eukprot:COSAG01_NODE_56142_length_320_cov_0.927602_1_plen_39_part_10
MWTNTCIARSASSAGVHQLGLHVGQRRCNAQRNVATAVL